MTATNVLIVATHDIAVELIDQSLSEFSARDLVSSQEVCDLLLDLRLLLSIEVEPEAKTI
ncbi:hypothetical protein [Actinomycetia phage DSL-LC01]|nr:hypothetical protein [Actinomycetia phage DSL-LC01]